MLFHRSWCRGIENVKRGLGASVFVRQQETRRLFVNFDPKVDELISEAEHMKTLDLEVPASAFTLVAIESKNLKFRAAR